MKKDAAGGENRGKRSSGPSGPTSHASPVSRAAEACADRPADADGPLTVVILPGASLLDITPLAASIALVRCPGCGATAVLAGHPVGTVSHATFVHQGEDCPVSRRIEAALASLRALQTAEQN